MSIYEKTTHRTKKVYRQSGYNYNGTPTIILKGKWLEDYGFGFNDAIDVECREGELIIRKKEMASVG